jgi:hypothetical protein
VRNLGHITPIGEAGSGGDRRPARTSIGHRGWTVRDAGSSTLYLIPKTTGDRAGIRPPIRPILALPGWRRSFPSGRPPGTAPGANGAIQREDAALVEAGVGFELVRSGARDERISANCPASRGELRSWGIEGLRGLVGAPSVGREV